MKNNLLSILLIGFASLLLCSCSNETSSNDNSSNEAQVEYDTIITFDPNTFEETVEIVERAAKSVKEVIKTKPTASLQYMSINRGESKDTIIIFYPDSYEEMVYVQEAGKDLRTLLVEIQKDKLKDAADFDFMFNEGEIFDTITTFYNTDFRLDSYLVEAGTFSKKDLK
jgi:FtsZ-interacting cell division protein YlmF